MKRGKKKKKKKTVEKVRIFSLLSLACLPACLFDTAVKRPSRDLPPMKLNQCLQAHLLLDTAFFQGFCVLCLRIVQSVYIGLVVFAMVELLCITLKLLVGTTIDKPETPHLRSFHRNSSAYLHDSRRDRRL